MHATGEKGKDHVRCQMIYEQKLFFSSRSNIRMNIVRLFCCVRANRKRKSKM